MRELSQTIKNLRESKGTQTAVAAQLKVVTSQQLGSYERGKYKPKADFFEAWKKEYGEDILAIQKGNTERNVSHETIKHTEMPKADDIKQNGDLGELSVYRRIFEGKTEYMVIPRSVLEKTKLISSDELDRKNQQIDVLIKLLGIELDSIRQGSVKSKQKT